jgi:hypothetical protein
LSSSEKLFYDFNTFKLHETPAGTSVFNNKSIIEGDSVVISIKFL